MRDDADGSPGRRAGGDGVCDGRRTDDEQRVDGRRGTRGDDDRRESRRTDGPRGGLRTDGGRGEPQTSGDGDGRRGRTERLLARLTGASVRERLVISVSALGLSVVVGFLLVYTAGLVAECATAAFLGSCYDPVSVFDELFLGAFGGLLADPTNGSFGATLAETTILVFTGLSVAVSFRAGVFNIGTQGQLVVGGLATAVAVLAVAPVFSGTVGTLVVVPFGLVVGALAGGAFGAIPGALKAYADANEVITTIMLNFVATGVTLYLIQSRFQDPASSATQTRPVPAFAQFPTPVFPDRARVSLVALTLALLAAVVVAYLIAGTSFGYDVRTSGIQPAAAAYGGVDAERTVVAAMAISGALGGIGGAVYVLMLLGRFQTGVPAYGFDGITVSILAGNNPLGVSLAALLFGVLKSGSVSVDVATNVPPELVGVLRGLIVLFVAAPEFFRMIGSRLDLAEREPAVTDGGTVDPRSGGSATDAPSGEPTSGPQGDGSRVDPPDRPGTDAVEDDSPGESDATVDRLHAETDATVNGASEEADATADERRGETEGDDDRGGENG